MLIALLTLMLLGGDSYEIREFIAEGQSNMAAAVEDPQRRQTALSILAEMEQAMAAGRSDTTALIERTQAEFTEEKVWSPAELEALFAEAIAARSDSGQRFIELRLKLRESLNDSEWASAFPEP